MTDELEQHQKSNGLQAHSIVIHERKQQQTHEQKRWHKQSVQ